MKSITFEYFYGGESEQFSFYRIPRQLLVGPEFKHVSTDAKLLYGLMLDRMGLSARNGWYDEENRVFIYYPLDEIKEALNCSNDKAVKLLAELDSGKGIGLIQRVKQGQGKPARIYVKRFTTREIAPQVENQPSPPPRKPDPEAADIARLMFEMYAQPSTSFGDIARHFADEGILIYDKELTRGFISQMLRNPIYDHHDTVKLIQCGMVPYAHDLVHGAYDPAPGEQVSNVLFKLKRPGGWARRTKLLPILSMSICVYSVSQSTTLLSTYLSRNFCTSTQAIISAHSLSLAMACSSSEI